MPFLIARKKALDRSATQRPELQNVA